MTIMRGLIASGKTTKCLELLSHGNTVRINKDSLRTMLHGDKFTGRNEGLTRDASRELAKMYLQKGTNVIIDDTNLNDSTLRSWKDLAKDLNVKIETVDMTDVSVETCIQRDSEREKPIGSTVIKNMAIRAGLVVFERDSIVLCDIDGTISDPTSRLHYVNKPEGEKKDWKAFFSEMSNDPVREDVRDKLLRYQTEGKTIIFMTARPEDYKEVTLKWLSDNNLNFAYTLLMRRSGDKRPDTDVKKDLFNYYFPDKSVVHAVLDDRPSIIRGWREMGLPVIDCGKGIEF